jgi:hypothetical protein
MTWRCCGSHRAAANRDRRRHRHRHWRRHRQLDLRSALSLRHPGAGSERGLRAAQRVEQIEEWSGTRSDPPRRWSPAGRGIPACGRGPVRGRRPAGGRIPAGGWVAIVPAGTPLRVIPVTRMRRPVAAVGPPVGRITSQRRRGYGRRRDSGDGKCSRERNSRRCQRECT